MPIHIIIYCLFFAVVYGFIFLVFTGLFILGWKKHWIWLKWLTGIPAALIVLLAVSFLAWCTYGIIDSMNPRSVFKDTFGESPSSDVNDIQSKVWFFIGEEGIFLTFKTTKSEFIRLLPSELTEQTLEDMKFQTSYDRSSDAPSWWSFRYEAGWIYYLRVGHELEFSGKHGFDSETEYYAYDPNTNTAYYRFLGID